MRKSFGELHREKLPIVMPAAHDALSARLIESAGFSAIANSGSGILAARHALPDIGIASFGEMLPANRDIIQATSLPCLVDIDDGYGGIGSVHRTVRMMEQAGAAAIVMEDQSREWKRPGQSAATSLASAEEFLAKIAVALQTRDSSEFWIYGRTDAYSVNGIDDALRRAALYAAAGVDGLFVAGVKSEEDLARIGKEFRGLPLIAVDYGDVGWPSLSASELGDLGFTQIIYPLALLLPVCQAMQDRLAQLVQAAVGSEHPAASSDLSKAQAILKSALNTQAWDDLSKP